MRTKLNSLLSCYYNFKCYYFFLNPVKCLNTSFPHLGHFRIKWDVGAGSTNMSQPIEVPKTSPQCWHTTLFVLKKSKIIILSFRYFKTYFFIVNHKRKVFQKHRHRLLHIILGGALHSEKPLCLLHKVADIAYSCLV